jgi:multidrug efflux system membrane fusion protein
MPRYSILALAVALTLVGCKKPNVFVPPPPAEVGVSAPVQQVVTPVLELTGSLAAYNQVDLVARVAGVLQAITYVDGSVAKPGDPLFLIEPAPYAAKLAQAEAEFTRQTSLAKNDFSSKATLDQAKTARESTKAAVSSAQGGVTLAALDLGYTQVAAPFAGVVTAHQVSVGNLVGAGGTTKLASMMQLNPIYANFTLSEQSVQRIKTEMQRRGISVGDLGKIRVEVGLMTEAGTPHAGALDYIEPAVDAATGTLRMRAVLPNPDYGLLPGYFVRVRIALQPQDGMGLLVPDVVLGSDQAGRYVLVANKDDVVELRRVEPGQLVGALRVIVSGLKPDDRVVVRGLGRATPGSKVAPVPAKIDAP